MTRAVVAILDRDEWEANTDVIVVADDRRRRLLWVPRDLWSRGLGRRINAAVRTGGGAKLIETLGEFGIACDASLVLRRGATEAALAEVMVTVPVPARLDFWYPLAPTLPIEEGAKKISFIPPAETLSGERLHQWIGARKSVNGDASGSDLARLERQQVLVRELMKQGFDFRRAIARPDLMQMVGDPLAVLARVDQNWTMSTFGPTVPAMHGQGSVLHLMPVTTRLLRAARRLAGRVARWAGLPLPASRM